MFLGHQKAVGPLQERPAAFFMPGLTKDKLRPLSHVGTRSPGLAAP